MMTMRAGILKPNFSTAKYTHYNKKFTEKEKNSCQDCVEIGLLSLFD